jgi:leucine-rich PPR motif-containing protein
MVFDMDKSIYSFLTIHRWESLNRMNYRLGSLRPVHGMLALKFLKWVIKQPNLEMNHLTHIISTTTHILVRARMYDFAKTTLKHMLHMPIGFNNVFGSLMETYPFCNSNPAVFDLLIRVCLRENMVDDALHTFRLMGFRGFKPSVYTCNMVLGSLVKDHNVDLFWSFFKEMVANGVSPNVVTFNILLNALCERGKFKSAGFLLKKMEETGHFPTSVTYNTLLNWYCKKGRYKAASELIDSMASKGIAVDVCTYNIMC